MSSYTKWDRAAYVERVGGQEEAERRRTALMARQSGYRLAEERVKDQPGPIRQGLSGGRHLGHLGAPSCPPSGDARHSSAN